MLRSIQGWDVESIIEMKAIIAHWPSLPFAINNNSYYRSLSASLPGRCYTLCLGCLIQPSQPLYMVVIFLSLL